MAKEEGIALGPLSYRVLTMLPASYRLYAKIRLKHLQPWIAEWVTPEIYAGGEGQGAADAAYETAMRMELSRHMGEACTGEAADVYKCFDQIQKQLLYRIMGEAGMPHRVREAYQVFQENLEAHSTIAGGMGEAHKKPHNYTTRRSFLDDVDITADESMDCADAFNGRIAEAPGRRSPDTLHRAEHLKCFEAGFTTTQEHLEGGQGWRRVSP